MLNIYFCGTCKKCLPKVNFILCDMCDEFIKSKCECGCCICDLCYEFELTKYYNLKSSLVVESKNQGYYLTICLKCDLLLNSQNDTDRKHKIKNCIIKSYPNLKLDEKNCCFVN